MGPLKRHEFMFSLQHFLFGIQYSRDLEYIGIHFGPFSYEFNYGVE